MITTPWFRVGKRKKRQELPCICQAAPAASNHEKQG
jgi:hypothetical protein